MEDDSHERAARAVTQDPSSCSYGVGFSSSPRIMMQLHTGRSSSSPFTVISLHRTADNVSFSRKHPTRTTKQWWVNFRIWIDVDRKESNGGQGLRGVGFWILNGTAANVSLMSEGHCRSNAFSATMRGPFQVPPLK